MEPFIFQIMTVSVFKKYTCYTFHAIISFDRLHALTIYLYIRNFTFCNEQDIINLYRNFLLIIMHKRYKNKNNYVKSYVTQ